MSNNKVTPKLLTDVRFVRLSLDEANNDGKIRVKGEFAKCGVATENKRIYPESVWSKEIGRLDKAMVERRVFGEMDHPSDGRTSLQRVSHIVTSLKTDKNGLVVGEAEILPTEAGKNLAALLSSGCKVGVSSRGYGSTKSNEKGEEVVQNDYKLVTFDFVAEPADSDAYPDLHTESTNNLIFEGVDMNAATAEQDKAKAAEWAKRLTASEGETTGDVRDEFSRDLLANIAKVKAEAYEQAKADLASDPKHAPAAAVLDKIRDILRPSMLEGDAKVTVEAKDAEIATLKNQIAERDLRIKTLEDENVELAAVAKEVGYKFWMERALAGDVDAETVRKLVGDVKQFERVDDLKAKVESVRGELARKRDEAKAVEDARRTEIEAATAAVEEQKRAAEEKAAKLEEGLKKALLSEKQLALKLYIEQRLTNHPKAAKIRSLVEGRKFSSTEEIDEVIAGHREPERDTDELEAVRARVRKQVGGGDEYVLDEEKTAPEKSRGRNGSYNGLGMPIGELKKLSGLNNAK